MFSVKLVKHSLRYKAAYIDMIEEWKRGGEPFTPFVLGEDPSRFSAMLARFRGFSKGSGVPDNFVPHTTCWLVREDGRVLGAVNIRHYLNDRLRNSGGHIGYGIRPSERGKGYATEQLRLALKRTRRMGIDRALLCCDTANLASARVIVKNGGRLDSEDVQNSIPFQRYWINLT